MAGDSIKLQDPEYRARLFERFTEKYEPEPNSGCWLWTGSLDGHGYAKIFAGRRSLAHHKIADPAHVIAYILFKGPLPAGLEIDHLCRVHCCVNPDHLEAVTHLENVRRGNSGEHFLRRTHCPHGHSYSEENTYRTKTGRSCRACKLADSKKAYAKKIGRTPRKWVHHASLQ